MKIALTGGTGFVGRSVAKTLLASDHEVTVLVRASSQRDRLTPGIATIVEGDLGDIDSIDAFCKDQDAVIHCGWWTAGESFSVRPDDVQSYYLKNVLGSINLLESSKKSGVSRFVFVSTGAVHGETLSGDLFETHPLWPTTIYGAAKAAIETAIHAYGFEQSGDEFCPSTVRPTSIYGVDQPIASSRFYDLVTSIAAGKDVNVEGGGKMVHVDDLANAICCVLNADRDKVRGQTFNCTGGLLTRRRVAEVAKEILGQDVEISGTEPRAGKRMRTEKIESIGMRFCQDQRLAETIRALI